MKLPASKSAYKSLYYKFSKHSTRSKLWACNKYLIYSNLSPPLALCVSVYLNLRIFLHTHYKHLAWININTFRFHFLIFHQYIDNILTVFLLVCVDVVVVVWLVAGLSCIVYCIEKTKGYLYLLNHLLPLAIEHC